MLWLGVAIGIVATCICMAVGSEWSYQRRRRREIELSRQEQLERLEVKAESLVGEIGRLDLLARRLSSSLHVHGHGG